MKDIIKFLVVGGVTFFAITLALILIYASPDEEPYVFAGAISYFAASLYLSTYIITLKKSTHVLLKWIIILLSGGVVVKGAYLVFLEIFPPVMYVGDKLAGNIFIFSIIIVSVSLYFLGKNMTTHTGDTDEK